MLQSVVEDSKHYRQATTAPNRQVGAHEVDLLERGFRLAHFLVPDRLRAIEIVCGALEKQQLQSFRENRRFYWRDKHPRHAVRRVTRRECDVLQWLIMAEAESYERKQEESACPSQSQMIIRYVKHVVEITSTMSSLYLNVGINRVLHRYSTAEAQAAYEELTGRNLGGDEYRRIKGILMRRILQRFGNLLRTTRLSRGELRFELRQDQKSWAGLVRECLQNFTPWSTAMACSAWRTATAVPALPVGDRNDAEIDHCHVFIEPLCHERLMKTIGAAIPEEMLALPKLFLADDDPNDRESRGKPVPLSAEERNGIKDYLRGKKRSRRAIATPRIQILLDGVACACLAAEEQTTFDLSIEEGANLIEIRCQNTGDNILLGTHLIEYDESGFAAAKARIVLETGNIGLEVLPLTREGVLPQNAIVRFRIHIHSAKKLKQGLAHWLHLLLSAGWKFAVPSAMFFAGILVAALLDRKLPVVKPLTEQRVATVHQQPLTTLSRLHETWYRLVPDEDFTRGERSLGYPTISIAPDSDLVGFEIPIQATSERIFGYAVELWAVDGTGQIFAYNFVKPQQTPQGKVLKVPVPVAVLKPGAYYTFKLRAQGQSRREWISNYSFQVLHEPEDTPSETR